MKLFLTDLDGTIRTTKSGATFINEPENQQIIPEAILSIKTLLKFGWTVIGITNQGGVKAGYKSLQDCLKEQVITMKEIIKITTVPLMQTVFLSVDEQEAYLVNYAGVMAQLNPNPPRGYRKPNIGMLLYAIAFYEKTMESSAMSVVYCGDRDEDIIAAQDAHIPFLTPNELYQGHFAV